MSASVGLDMIYDTLDFVSGGAMANKKQPPRKLKWHGWQEEESAVEYFNKNKIATKCICKCEDCGFYYLDINGDQLALNENGHFAENANKPLCGEW